MLAIFKNGKNYGRWRHSPFRQDLSFLVRHTNPSGRLNSNYCQSNDISDVENQNEGISALSSPQTLPAEMEPQSETLAHKSEELPVEDDPNESIQDDLSEQRNQRQVRLTQPSHGFSYYAPGKAIVNAVPMNINAIPQYSAQPPFMRPLPMQVYFSQQICYRTLQISINCFDRRVRH